MSSSTTPFNDSVSDTNMRPFQGGQLANGEADAVNPSDLLVVVETSTVAESSAVSGNVQPKPKRRKSDPKSWKKNEIKKAKSQGM